MSKIICWLSAVVLLNVSLEVVSLGGYRATSVRGIGAMTLALIACELWRLSHPHEIQR